MHPKSQPHACDRPISRASQESVPLGNLYEEKEGHNVTEPTQLCWARSTDGGETWSTSPASFGGAEGPVPGDIDFAHPDFALRVLLDSYFISFDRGRTWAGPYGFGVYGVRQRQGISRISAKVSADNGSTWGGERLLRGDYVGPDGFGDVDLGYPRAFVRPDGKIVAVYYWATPSRPEQHIAATVFQVLEPPPVGIGSWVRGLTHAPASGANRLLLLAVHSVERGSQFKNPQSVRYGGQEMEKLLERGQVEGDWQTYVALFYLLESGIQQAVHGDFQVDWQPNRPDNWEAASAFLTDVDPTNPFGDRDTAAATSGNQAACHPFSVATGEAVVLAGTARERGSFTLPDGFEKGDEFDLTRGGIRPQGDGVVGHRAVTEAAVLQSIITHSAPGTLVVASVQVRQAFG